MPNLDPYPYLGDTPTRDPAGLPLPLQFPTVSSGPLVVDDGNCEDWESLLGLQGHLPRLRLRVLDLRSVGVAAANHNISVILMVL